MTAVSFDTVFTAALLGAECRVVGVGGEREPLPVRTWQRTADVSDRALVACCQGATLDVGCGPGRLTEALAELGRPVLGIDVVSEAVRQTRARGVAALRRDVFGTLPAEGRWATVLLADGNIGIGGDPRALLSRVRDLVEPGGRVVVELAGPGQPTETRLLRLETPELRSRPFRWTRVGPDGIGALAAAAGLVCRELSERHGRWAAILERVR